ncbi:MAG: hypothetical protein ACFFG0_01710 [Candidatus Thorarchaeota archaeon]
MTYDSELSQKQVKNLKRRIVSWIWETSPRRIIEVALFCKIKVPKHLIEKYISEK